MIKKVTTLALILTLTVFTASVVFADGKKPPSLGQKKDGFSKKKFSDENAWSKKGKATSIPGAPDPTGASGGYNAPIPFSSGIAILAFGSILYFIKRTRDENSEEKLLEDIENS